MLRRTGFVILALLFAGAAGVAISGRGPWYDEFYSLYMVRPEAPLVQLVAAWLRDNHPPLFYACVWLWARLLGVLGLGITVESLRTINCVIMVIASLAFVQIARADPWFRRLAWYYALALTAMFPALDQVDQLRSYFLSLILTALVLPLLVQCLRKGAGTGGSVRLGLILTLAFSVHLVTTVIVLGLLAATFLHLVLVRRWHDAWRLALIGAIALIPFGVSMALQLSTMIANTRSFWIPPGLNAARWSIETALSGALFANPLLLLCALAGMGVLIAKAWRQDHEARETIALVNTLALGLILALGVMVIAHSHRPMLIARYLIALCPVAALILALGAERATRTLSFRAVAAIDAALLVITGLALDANLTSTLHQWSWNGTSRIIAAHVHRCPGTLVYPDMHWAVEILNSSPHDHLDVLPFAYATMAHRYGFALARAGSHSLSATCPTLFWTEHAVIMHPDANTVIRSLRASGYPVRSGRMIRRDLGWVLITPPTG